MTHPDSPPQPPPPQREEWLQHDVLENLDIGVAIIARRDRSVRYSNRALATILGPPDEEPSYGQLEELFLQDCTPTTPHESAHEQEPVRLGNRLIHFSLRALAEDNQMLVLRDDTERVRLESIAQAVNTMDNIGFIFSGIRHEVGNPLNTIKMTISVLQRNLETFSRATVDDYLQRTSQEIGRMEYLLKSLKNFSMYERVESQEHDLRQFLEHFRSLTSKDLEKKGIDLQFQLPEPTLTRFDPRALHQAMINLLSNACDALTLQPHPSIRISATVIDHLAWIKIEDNGCGMNEEDQELLFQPFFTRKSHGNGLGLVITRKLLAKMNASMHLRSQEGVGTIVRVALPLAPAAEVTLNTTTGEEHAHHPAG